ncbi:TIGR03089 family protein [Austwickia sp. TVS 96-490-7B]|uniref:TIGR03089 family protein n=1 Tax=Austwickia sp. TVS 96-490-7B TaxID=2830843 RepID=UPI001C588A21|nr:TIGR03089 family protein [Austwickia sp. TVS 96-490-7B]
MTTPRDILRALLADNPTRPRLTWYGPADERIELSARVLDNWVTKAANLLLEEGDVTTGDTVLLDLPRGHWRGVYWSLATWTIGATLVLTEAEIDALPATDVLITHRAEVAERSTAPLRILVTPAALARRYPGAMPIDVLDEAADLSTYGDLLIVPTPTESHRIALTCDDGTSWTGEDLVPAAPAAGVRVHLDADTEVSATALLRAPLGIWAGGGSVVLTATGSPLPASRIAMIRHAEGVDPAQ